MNSAVVIVMIVVPTSLLENRALRRVNELVPRVPEVEALSSCYVKGALYVHVNKFHVLGLRYVWRLFGRL